MRRSVYDQRAKWDGVGVDSDSTPARPVTQQLPACESLTFQEYKLAPKLAFFGIRGTVRTLRLYSNSAERFGGKPEGSS